ncbi:hypothetical protein DPV78_007869 [Talaromyces pinophilus]|nr:hypothetical protein DPV78_007869 [Talaromyces pinophilus]
MISPQNGNAHFCPIYESLLIRSHLSRNLRHSRLNQVGLHSLGTRKRQFCIGIEIEISLFAHNHLGNTKQRQLSLYPFYLHAPYGLHGGQDGALGVHFFVKGDRTINLGPKNTIRAEQRDQVFIMTPGGGGAGGWGDSKDSMREINGVRAVQHQQVMGSVATYGAAQQSN